MGRKLVAAAALLWAAMYGVSQTAVRADGAQVRLRVYGEATKPGGACAPVILFSPGLGGTERGYSYFGEGLAAAGYRVIVMGHAESGPGFLRRKLAQANGLTHGALLGIQDKDAEAARLLDVDATVKFADEACRPQLMILAGHSMGAITTVIEAGAKNVLGLAPSAAAHRFAAFVVLSPNGPGPVIAENGWRGIRKPVLMMTGTRDQGTAGDYRWRMEAYAGLPKATGSHWLAVIDGATHMNFAGRMNPQVASDVITATTAFLEHVEKGQWKAAPPELPGVAWQQK